MARTTGTDPAQGGIALVVECGHDKAGRPEACGRLELRPGELVAVVGATGSGKTRLLADIERLSPGDSPTGRRVTLTGVPADVVESGFAVARISQSMQFFLDLSVAEFLRMHASARGRAEGGGGEVLAWANRLAGEPFDASAPLATLSGGQARALMIADVVLVGSSPVLLIDEIENAGIDRHAAMDFLGSRDRLVVLATHDPLMALRADRRLVLAEGGIRKVLKTTKAERAHADRLAVADREVAELRARMRAGERLG